MTPFGCEAYEPRPVPETLKPGPETLNDVPETLKPVPETLKPVPETQQDNEVNQMKRYEKETADIKHLKEFIST